MGLKIGGRVIEGPKEGLLVLPRDDGDIVFKFVAVTNDSDYEKISPVPKPPRVWKVKLAQNVEDVEDPGFKLKLKEWGERKTNWIFLKSIEPSQIEWVTVKMDDPATFENWRKDLKEAGFSIGEVNTIFGKFIETNMVTDDMLDEARKRFFGSQAQKGEAQPSSSTDEPTPT
jgi:hypothetical protein